MADEAGAYLPGVTLTLMNTESKWSRRVTTDSGGSYASANLPPGRYEVTAWRQGFSVTAVRDVVLNVNERRDLDIRMRVGEISETVVVEDHSSVNSESAAVGVVIDRRFVENLPLNGRGFNALIELTPGAVLTKATYLNKGQFSVNGQRANTNYFTVDGVSANVGIDSGISIGHTGGGTIPALSALGGTNNLVSVDALREFSVLTSTYAPEFGRTPGAQVNIVTRSGTNALHGMLFEYFRNDALDANDWFANSRGQKRPPLRQNDFGGVLGGPVVRNRTFFFLSYEGLRLRQPQVRVTAVPSVAARQTAPTAVRPFLNAFPLPNGPDYGDGFAELSASYSNPSSLDATSVRIDQILTKGATLFGRFSYAPSEVSSRGGGADIRTSLSSIGHSSPKTVTVTLGSTQTISANVSNDLRFNYSRNRGRSIYTADDFGGAVPLPESLFLPPFASPNDSLFGLDLWLDEPIYIGSLANNLQRQLNVVDGLAVSKGAHLLKFGADWRRLSPVLDTYSYFHQVTFIGVEGALTGQAAGVSIGSNSGPATARFDNFSAYAQDTWKPKRRLTATYGLRWEFNPAPSRGNADAPLLATGLEDPAAIRLAPPGAAPWRTPRTSFAPRVGLAFSLSETTGYERVVRGGFGIFYDVVGSVPIGSRGSGALLTDVPYPLDVSQATPPPPGSLAPPYTAFAYPSRLKLPRTYQWNVAVEQSLGPGQAFSATYVGAAGRELLRRTRLFRPNPDFQFVHLIDNSATSDYHALQLQFERRLSRGLQALASYTWSHSIDISSSDGTFGLPIFRLDPRADRGPSDFDVRHSFSGATTYDIPAPSEKRVAKYVSGGWSVDAIFRARSATPVNVLTGLQLFNVFGVWRPDLVQGVPLYVEDASAAGGRRINRAAFSAPPQTRQGTLGRNALRGFPAHQLDFSLRRQFPLSERLRLQLRADLFNAFNHPNFADPVSTLNNAQFFGRSVSMLGRGLGTGGDEGGLNPLYQIGGPRSVQLALKLQF